MLDKYIKIGFTKKTHGAGGYVRAVVEDPYLEDFHNSDFIFIEIYGKPAPFFIENIQESNDILLKIEEINSPEDAKTIISKDIFLREKDLKTAASYMAAPDMDMSFKLVEGYILIDIEKGEIGIIEEVQEFPQQEMAVVDFNNKKIYIPLHPELVTGIDEINKKITLRLPEGLLEL
ncbi:MAG TPA: hypothetical protein ENJ95_13495 [Bacteroidetes bacterium]|nr:hypothetical protein [Bacteroidota bacterium]